jgi:hypothetical protein
MNGRMLLKTGVVTFSNNLYSLRLLQRKRLLFLSEFNQNRNVSTDFIKSLEYEIGLAFFVVDEKRRNETRMQFLQLFCESA